MANEKTLMQKLVEAGVPVEHMDHHESDLYVLRTTKTQAIIEAYCQEKGQARPWFAPVFCSEIDGREWYDCAFAYDPYWTAVARGECPEI